MICPKCEEGELTKIHFTKSGKAALLCEVCGTVWFDGEEVKEQTGHMIESLTLDDGMEYTFVDPAEDEEEEDELASYPKV